MRHAQETLDFVKCQVIIPRPIRKIICNDVEEGEDGNRPKKLIICVDRRGGDEDRTGCSKGWDSHVISKEPQGPWVVL
jgi:hypothetical protein